MIPKLERQEHLQSPVYKIPPVVVKDVKLMDTAHGRRTLRARLIAQKQAELGETDLPKGIPNRSRVPVPVSDLCHELANALVDTILRRSKSHQRESATVRDKRQNVN
jgi:hypothetical protein